MERDVTSPAQTRAIHALRKAAGMEEADYRGLLAARFRVASSTALSDVQARRLIDELKGISGQPANAPASRDKASGPYAPVLQALWLAAFNLGITRSKHDAAMMKFVARQTGVSHTRFLHDAALASKAIEGLKKWMEREAGVNWPQGEDRSDDNRIERKRAVVTAIKRKMEACGAIEPRAGGEPEDWRFLSYGSRHCGLPSGFAAYLPADWDILCNRLGARLRAHLAERARAAA